MTTPRTTRRRSHAAANDVVLHKASLEMLATRGLDLFSFSDLAREVGLTRAPIYSRYDVAIDLWQTTLETVLAEFLEANQRWHGGEDPVPAGLLSAYTKPSSELSAAVEVLAVARRFPSLQDITRSSLERLIDSYVAATDGPRSLAVAQISVAVGSVFLAPFLGPTEPGGWKSSLPILREFLSDRSVWDLPTVRSEPFEIPLIVETGTDDVFEMFLPSIIRVIARTGYEHATTTRISREAGHAFNTLYEQFDSKEQLMERVVQHWVEAGILLAITPFIGVTPEEYVQRSVGSARSLTADANRTFRNLRNEMLLAARHHPSIGKATARRFRGAVSDSRSLFEASYRVVSDENMIEVARFSSLVRANGVGLCLLASVTPTLVDVDWTAASTALQQVLWARLFGRLTPR